MKASILKWFYVASVLFFIDWILMVITGCLAGMCNATDNFFCGIYCIIGLILLSISFILVVYLIVSKRRIA